MKNSKSFGGTGWSFPPHFSKPDKGVKMISDEEDIRNSLEVLLLTRVGERIMQPGYGCNLDVALFEPIDLTMQTYLRDLVSTAIYLYEPRVKPEEITLTAVPEEGKIEIEISYIVRGTNTRHNLVFPFYTGEGTLLDNPLT